MEKVSVETRRNKLFPYLDAVLALADKKIKSPRGIKDKDKRAWARVLVQAVSAYGSLLKDDTLELRIIELEEKLKNGVLIPKPEEKKKNWTR